MLSKIKIFLGSNWIIGVTAIAAFFLSAFQLAVPYLTDVFVSYNLVLDAPETINLFCAGSEGIDAADGSTSACDGSGSVVLMATPLSYINDGGPHKTVWLRHERVKVQFNDATHRPAKVVYLSWERVTSDGKDWHAPFLEQIKSGESVSHGTLFYPANLGCDKQVGPAACGAANSYSWREFADAVIGGSVTGLTASFVSDFRGPGVLNPPECEWQFGKADISTLKEWRDKMGKPLVSQLQKGSVAPSATPYALSAYCDKITKD